MRRDGLAEHLKCFGVTLAPLDGSGVTGRAALTFAGSLEGAGPSLTVDLFASGLTPGAHFGHIHGFTGDDSRNGIAPVRPVFDPDIEGDRGFPNDGNGFTGLTEGPPFCGGILQTLTGLTANGDGIARYRRTFDVEPGGPLDNDAFALSAREVVLHGLFAVEVPEGFPGGKVDQNAPAPGTCNALLPNAVGEVRALDAPSAVPIPAAGVLPVGALRGLGLMHRRRG